MCLYNMWMSPLSLFYNREVTDACGNNSADINYMICELTDPSSIQSFAQQFKDVW